MKEQFVPYEIAIKLKEKGFIDECMANYEISLTAQENEEDGFSGPFGWKKGEVNFNKGYFVNNSLFDFSNENWLMCAAPLWQQVIDWLEDKFNLKFSIAYWNGYNGFLSKEMQYKYEVYIIPENAPSITVRGDKGSSYFDTRKDAITAAILKALTLI